MGKLDGKVVFITGAGRGQGRSHAMRLAALGAAVVAVDICEPIDSVPYPLATRADLDETVADVQAAGGRAIAAVADIRDPTALECAVDLTMSSFGRLDIVVANAGVCPMSNHDHPDVWQDVLDVNLTGTRNTLRATSAAVVNGGRGGAMVITGSGLGLAGMATDGVGALAYIASKHGVIGLMRSYANLLAPASVRVNCVLPSGINTPMVDNAAMHGFLAGFAGAGGHRNALPVDMIEEIDISEAVGWLVSDEARYVTGAAIPVDAGWLNSA